MSKDLRESTHRHDSDELSESVSLSWIKLGWVCFLWLSSPLSLPQTETDTLSIQHKYWPDWEHKVVLACRSLAAGMAWEIIHWQEKEGKHEDHRIDTQMTCMGDGETGSQWETRMTWVVSLNATVHLTKGIERQTHERVNKVLKYF